MKELDINEIEDTECLRGIIKNLAKRLAHMNPDNTPEAYVLLEQSYIEQAYYAYERDFYEQLKG